MKARLDEMSVGKIDFVERRDLWTDEQKEAAEQVKRTIDEKRWATFRVSWVTSTASSGAKTLTAHDFQRALQNGDLFQTASLFMDTANNLCAPMFATGRGSRWRNSPARPTLSCSPTP